MFFIVGSISAFYLSLFGLSSMKTYSMGSLMGKLLSFENQYFLLFFFATAYSLIEYGLQILDAEINNGIQEYKHT
jgi:hypothetical protein